MLEDRIILRALTIWGWFLHELAIVQHMFCKSNLPSMSILLISINLSYISDDWYIDGNMNKASLHNKHDV